MKPSKKLLCCLLATCCVFGAAPPVWSDSALSASAESAVVQETECIKIGVTYDKSSYKPTDTATVTVTLTNISDETINDISLSVFSDNCLLVKGSEIKLKGDEMPEALNRNETITIAPFRVVIDSKKCSVGFFDKILIFFKRLFAKPTALSAAFGISADSEKQNRHSDAELKLPFTKGNPHIAVKAGCRFGYTDGMETHAEEWEANITDKLNQYENSEGDYSAYVKNALSELNITQYDYDTNTDTYWITTEEGIYTVPTNENDDVFQMPESEGKEEKKYGNNPNDVLILDCLGSSGLYNQLSTLELEVGQISNCTLEDALALEHIPLVVFLSHGNVDCWGNPYICVQKNAANKQVLNAAVSNRQAVKILGHARGTTEVYEYIGLLPKFFTANYKNNGYTFDSSVIYLGICNGTKNDALAKAFIESGCSSVIGFSDKVGQDDNLNYISALIPNLITSSSLGKALEHTTAPDGLVTVSDNRDEAANALEKTTINVSVHVDNKEAFSFTYVAPVGNANENQGGIKYKAKKMLLNLGTYTEDDLDWEQTTIDWGTKDNQDINEKGHYTCQVDFYTAA